MAPLSPRSALVVCLVSVALGIALRFIWPSDMEWKYDEKYMFEQARLIADTGRFPALGMPSGAGGLPNPGLSMALFGVLAFLAATPVGMVLWVMGLNAAALALFLLWIRKVPPEEDRPVWHWALSFWALSSLPVLFSRKIWAQDLLPFFVVLLLWAWSFRHRRISALLFGLLAALLGQIHMSGFFLAAGLLIVLLVSEIRSRTVATRWPFVVAGGALGALPLLPWIALLGSGKGAPMNLLVWAKNAFSLKFFTHGLGSAWGVNLKEYLQPVFQDEMLAEPRVFGTPTWGFAFAHMALLLLFASSLFFLVRRRSVPLPSSAKGPLLALLVTGALLTLTGVNVQAHYLIVVYPVLFLVPVLALRTLPRPRIFLLLALVLQLSISLVFLAYVHRNGGAEGADYGKSWRSQVEGTKAVPR